VFLNWSGEIIIGVLGKKNMFLGACVPTVSNYEHV
jgi:hypothetical protein